MYAFISLISFIVPQICLDGFLNIVISFKHASYE